VPLRREEVLRDVLRAMGEQELAEARRLIPSATLKAAVRLIVQESQQRARLFIPHYWAIYYHDGRGVVSPRSARKLVFFDNPREDPRNRGGARAERASRERRLTRAEYQRGLEINAERRARGQRPFMFVVDAVGPSRPRPFFDELAVGATRRSGPLAAREFDRHIQRLVDEDPDLRPERKRARFRLG